MPETTYPYQNTQLDKISVANLIRSTFGGSGRVLKRSSIMSEITELHLKLGGQSSTNRFPANIYNVALRGLRSEGVAESTGSGNWHFVSGELQISESEAAAPLEPSDESRPDTPGLYVYYYPSHAELAAFRGETRMYCKIGSTGKIIADRVNEQVGTSTPEQPVIGLTVECTRDTWATLETAVHAILKVRGQHSPQSPGREWFTTSIEEVCEIVRFVDPRLTLNVMPQDNAKPTDQRTVP